MPGEVGGPWVSIQCWAYRNGQALRDPGAAAQRSQSRVQLPLDVHRLLGNTEEKPQLTGPKPKQTGLGVVLYLVASGKAPEKGMAWGSQWADGGQPFHAEGPGPGRQGVRLPGLAVSWETMAVWKIVLSRR